MVYSNPIELNPCLILPRFKGTRGQHPHKRRYSSEQEARRAQQSRHYHGFASSPPPGKVTKPSELPSGPLVTVTRPTPAAGREMLYELIQFFGTDEAARMLGFELGKESRKQFGSDAYYDAYYSETNLRSVWFLWSLTFCPSNLRDSFHLQTWGYYNTEFTGPVADACRASALHRLKKVHAPRKKTRSEKRKETLARRLAKLPPKLRYVYSKDPERLKKRKELMDQIVKEEETKKRRGRSKQKRERGNKQKFLHNASAKHRSQGRIKPVTPPSKPE